METNERIEKLKPNPFIDGPGDYLAKYCAIEMLKVDQWKLIFGEFIDSYKRMDYPIRALPCIRIYNEVYSKESDNSWINGDLTMDLIFPANLRRLETQDVQDIVSSAVLQQYRSQTFFEALCANVPGLNELGRRFSVDKKLGFEWGENVVPLTQITVNFRIDLRQWDEHLESDDRTVNEPFKRTLGDLEQIVTKIQGLRDDDSVDVEVGIDQNVQD